MGCFNVSCGVSAKSMYTDRAALLPLVPSRWTDSTHEVTKDGGIKMRGAFLVSNSGIRQFFVPLSMPIFGELNSYGRLENVERDANVECIEQCFGMTIDEFMELVVDPFRHDEDEELPTEDEDIEKISTPPGADELYVGSEKGVRVRLLSFLINEGVNPIGMKVALRADFLKNACAPSPIAGTKGVVVADNPPKGKVCVEFKPPLSVVGGGRLTKDYGKFRLYVDANLLAVTEHMTPEQLAQERQEIIAQLKEANRKDFLRVKKALLANIAGMYVHRDVYDLFARTSLDEGGRSEFSIWDEGELTDYVLGLLGFKFTGEVDKGRERYNRLLTCDRWPRVKIWSDKRWIRVEMGKTKCDCAYRMKDLVALIHKDPKNARIPAKLRAALRKTGYYSVKVDEAIASYSKSAKEAEELTVGLPNEYLAKHGISRWLSWADPYDISYYLSFMSHHDRYGIPMFMDLYGQRLQDVKPALCDFHLFLHNMHGINRQLMPSWNGYQHGNHYAHRALLETTLKIINDELKEMESW